MVERARRLARSSIRRRPRARPEQPPQTLHRLDENDARWTSDSVTPAEPNGPSRAYRTLRWKGEPIIPTMQGVTGHGLDGERSAVAIDVVTRVADAVMANVGRAIVNKEDEVRLCLVTLLCEGHLLIEDVPGVGKTMLAKSLARSLDCTVPPHPVHARPAALGRHRRPRLQPEGQRVRVPAGPRLRADPARRRDQPRQPQDPGRAAGGDGGAPGHHRRRHARPAQALHGHGHAEPGRVLGHVPAARGPARPLPDEGAGSATCRRRKRPTCSASTRSSRRCWSCSRSCRPTS